MKKTLLLVSLFVGGLFTMNAQTTVWSEDFDDLDISDWTLYDEDGDGSNWAAVQTTNEGNPVNTPGLRSNSWASVPLTPDNWAVSPLIDLTGISGEITLNWEVWAPDAAYSDENYSVYVATGNTVSDFMASDVTFNQLVTDNGPGGSDNIYSLDLDISSFAGQSIYVAFRHHDVSDVFSLVIDTVSVTYETASVDSHLASSFSVYPNPVKDVLNISNSINAEINSVIVTDINGRTVKQANSNVSQINISDLNAGVYFVNINSNEGSLTKKVVKQ